jgi:hypothetical protein
VVDGDVFPNLVGAHSYTWYGTDLVQYWDGSYVGDPALATYDSSDDAVIDGHVRWALAHGINWFSATWWGPGSYSTETLVDHVVEADLIDRLNASVLYEPKDRFEYSSGRVDLDEGRPRRVLREDLRQMERTLFDRDAYLHVDGPAVDSTWRWFGRPHRIKTVAVPRERMAPAEQLLVHGTPIDSSLMLVQNVPDAGERFSVAGTPSAAPAR